MSPKNDVRVLKKLMREHEKVETPAQEARESKKTQDLERKLGLEARKTLPKGKKGLK